MQITEQQIISLAPNATAASNGKKISQKGGFVKLCRSEDETFYMGECQGSGKSNYITSVDNIHPEQPIFRCSCPSRQFPCKHSLALLYEIASGKEFELIEIPSDIMEKRAKKEAREEKKLSSNTTQKKPTKVSQASQIKKMKKQLEGLEMTKQLVDNLLKSGLGTIGGTSLKNYRDLSKQLGDYYLPGPQTYMNRLILTIEDYQKDSDERHYNEAIHILVKLHALTKKSETYLKEKIESNHTEIEDNILYEELGGIWKTEQLNQLGLVKENARLVQLSFQVIFDKARKEYIDKGYWADVDTGEISINLNYRPIKALKYIKQEDTIFDMLCIPTLTYYPGGINKRVRWEGATFSPITKEILYTLRQKAYTEIPEAVKQVKNEIKNTLSNSFVAVLIHFSKIGKSDLGFAAEDQKGNRILLKDRHNLEKSIPILEAVPNQIAFENQVLFGVIYYEETEKRICMQPYSILTEETIIRLLY